MGSLNDYYTQLSLSFTSSSLYPPLSLGHYTTATVPFINLYLATPLTSLMIIMQQGLIYPKMQKTQDDLLSLYMVLYTGESILLL